MAGGGGERQKALLQKGAEPHDQGLGDAEERHAKKSKKACVAVNPASHRRAESKYPFALACLGSNNRIYKKVK